MSLCFRFALLVVTQKKQTGCKVQSPSYSAVVFSLNQNFFTKTFIAQKRFLWK